MPATLTRLCIRCGRPLAEHDTARPDDRDPVAWDAYVGAACGSVQSQDRLERAVESGVSIDRMLDAQKTRLALDGLR